MFFSVVIPTYNRQPILEKCLKAMENQVLRPDSTVEGYEIVLVDDGSTDGTVEWIQAGADEFPHVALYEQDHEGAAIARNFRRPASQRRHRHLHRQRPSRLRRLFAKSC